MFPRFVIFAAGAFMNFLTGFLILVWLCSNLSFVYAPVITGFADGFEAQGENALMAGDRIVSIDGERVLLYEDISIFLNLGNGETYDFVVERDGRQITLTDLPLAPREYPNEDGTSSVRFGLNFGEIVEATPLMKLKMAGLHSVDFVRLVWYSLEMLVTGQVGLSDMSGPVGIVTTISDVGQGSTSLFMAAANIGYLTALIAINLAVMNLLPIPALDGGQIFIMFVTTLVTKVTKRPVNPKYAGYLNYAGFVALMLFMLVVTASDIFKLFVCREARRKDDKADQDRLCNGGRRRTGDDSVHVQYQYRRCGSDGGTDSSLGGSWLPDRACGSAGSSCGSCCGQNTLADSCPAGGRYSFRL